MDDIDSKIKATNIQSFRNKMEKIYGVKMDEKEAVESFSNFSGFISTLIEIDKSMRASS